MPARHVHKGPSAERLAAQRALKRVEQLLLARARGGKPSKLPSVPRALERRPPTRTAEQVRASIEGQNHWPLAQYALAHGSTMLSQFQPDERGGFRATVLLRSGLVEDAIIAADGALWAGTRRYATWADWLSGEMTAASTDAAKRAGSARTRALRALSAADKVLRQKR